MLDAGLIRWLARAPPRCRRIASVCTGAFLLARGRAARRPPRHHPLGLRRRARRGSYPAVDVRGRPDLRPRRPHLDLGGRDRRHGPGARAGRGGPRPRARAADRPPSGAVPAPAGQPVAVQRDARAPSSPQREPLREVQRQVLEDVAGRHTVEAMAERAHMSPRNFARAFRAETGVTPARYVESVRLEAARRRLEEHRRAGRRRSRARAASARRRRCGASFLRALAVGPPEYRRRFHSSFTAIASGPSRPRAGPPRANPSKSTKGETDEDRDRALRPVHRARRGRPLRGAQPAARGERHVRGGRGRAGAHRQRHARRSWPSARSRSSPTRTSCSSPAAPARSRSAPAERMLEWLREADATSTWTTSVCTGSLILAAAGLLDGRRATGHWLAMDELRRLGAEPTGERVVFDGKIVTGAGVSAGIDMALALAERIAGRRGRAGDPARDRVRPAAAVRRGLAREGARRRSSRCCAR